ncbi:hypothetical protein O181_031266 [Austropuccinia psidii MF-1]|uniref:Oligopeptide transporter n=1 Tax=Austropuccinia psidii MF-1 TaxID=1389203 RepID=A0A9Q3CUI7_9BASI|nr:hypothetical protein [Austropuccinia psidii MF-1]
MVCSEVIPSESNSTTEKVFTKESKHYGEKEDLECNVDITTVTIRSVLVGLSISAFGAACAQIFMFKPIVLHVHSLFVQLACVTLGKILAQIPGPTMWNPGPFNIKETTFSSIMACAASSGAITSTEMIGARALLFDQQPRTFSSLAIILSSQLIGYGWAGLLRPILVYPSNINFPSVLPSVALFESLYSTSPSSKKRISFFKKALVGTGIYQLFPTYIAPALQAVSPWCLALPKTREITHLFGGARVGEGLGFLSFSFDWTAVGAHGPLFTPLDAQCNQLLGHVLAIFVFSAAYRFNWFGGGKFPFISFELLDQKGNKYDTKAILNLDGSENIQAVQELGLPRFSTAYIIGKSLMCLATSAAFTKALLENRRQLQALISRKSVETDPHRLICRNYTDFPAWGFVTIMVLSTFLAFLTSHLSSSGLSNWGLFTALLLSGFLSLASGFFYGTTGVRLHTSPVVQMIGGFLFPGNALGTMWFTNYGSSTASQSTLMLKELKLICTCLRYAFEHHPPPYLCLVNDNLTIQCLIVKKFNVVTGQLLGTITGVLVNFLVFKTILTSERDALITSTGNGVFSGMHFSSFEAQSITYGIFGKRLYWPGKQYSIVLYMLLAGFVLPIPFHLLRKYRPRSFLCKTNVAMIAGTFYMAIQGITSGATAKLLTGFWSQYYMRRYRKEWYENYNYVLSAALDGGTQMSILILTFLFQGAAGLNLPFPNYFLNPKSGPKDYCFADQ